MNAQNANPSTGGNQTVASTQNADMLDPLDFVKEINVKATITIEGVGKVIKLNKILLIGDTVFCWRYIKKLQMCVVVEVQPRLQGFVTYIKLPKPTRKLFHLAVVKSII